MRPPGINSAVSALRFFFTVTLDRPDLARRLTVIRQPRKLPLVLSVEEVARLLEAAPGPKYKAALGTAYGAGLRVSEIVALKVSDIDSTRMLIRVEQGKGRKDRHAMLSPQLLHLLRAWWRVGKRRGVMLPSYSRAATQGLTERAIARTLGVSNGVVHGYLRRARLAGLSWPLPEGMDDEGLELLLFPAPKAASQSPRRPVPDWSYVEKELRCQP